MISYKTKCLVFETAAEAEYMCIEENLAEQPKCNIIIATDASEYELPLKSANSKPIKVSAFEPFVLEATKTDSFMEYFKVL